MFCTAAGDKLHLYGDSAYSTNRHLVAPFPNADVAAPHLSRWNREMSSVRVAVEWSIGKVYQLFPYFRNSTRHCVFRDPLANRFCVGVLLTNASVCLYGSNASKYFDCPPPTLFEYFDGIFLTADNPLPMDSDGGDSDGGDSDGGDSDDDAGYDDRDTDDGDSDSDSV